MLLVMHERLKRAMRIPGACSRDPAPKSTNDKDTPPLLAS